MNRWPFLALAALLARPGTASAADSVMALCGQQYQAAKATGTLNGQSWNQYRTDCAVRLKAQSAAATTAAPAPAPAAAPATATAAPADPAPAPATTMVAAPKPESGGRAAMLIRQKQCGAEWRAQKATLMVQTPDLTWPTYWSRCNTRLKAAGR